MKHLTLIILLASPAFAGSMDGPIERPQVGPPSEWLQCPSKPGRFYKPGHKILCDETPEEPKSPPSVECSYNEFWAPDTLIARNGKPKPEKECA